MEFGQNMSTYLDQNLDRLVLEKCLGAVGGVAAMEVAPGNRLSVWADALSELACDDEGIHNGV